MRYFLNTEMSDIAKRILHKKDIAAISEITGKAESHVVQVVRGNCRTDGDVIDCIQKLCKMRAEMILTDIENKEWK